GVTADDDMAQFVDVTPLKGAFFERLHKIPRLDPRLLLAVDHDRFAHAHGHAVQFGLAEKIGAHGVDVRPLGDPLAVQDRLAAGGGGDDDVLVLTSHFRTRNRFDFGLADLAHFVREATAVVFVGAVNLHALNPAHLADRDELGACLFTAAE